MKLGLLSISIGLLCISVIAMLIFPMVQQTRTQQTIQTLLRQSARWALASEQDKSPLIALLHANYGVGYLWALSDIATSQEIEEVGGVNYVEFASKITGIQDKATKQISQVCPKFVGDADTTLLQWAGNMDSKTE